LSIDEWCVRDFGLVSYMLVVVAGGFPSLKICIDLLRIPDDVRTKSTNLANVEWFCGELWRYGQKA
jgi:hypothetical protein